MALGTPRVRAAVVGGGHMGQYHGRVYAELWDVDLVGIVDIDPERAAAVSAQYDTAPFGCRARGRSRRAVQRRRAGATEDRGAPHPDRVAAPGAVRAARPEGHGRDGS